MTSRIQALVLAAWAALIAGTIYYGQTLLGEKGDVAALAGLITIFGISANNLVQSIGRREREKAKREFDVRKSIYMDFADSVARKLAHLSKLLRFDITDSETMTNDHAFAAAGNKVRLVATSVTLECFEKLQKTLVMFEMDVRQERRGISLLVTEMKQIDEQYNKNQETMAQINTYLQNMRPTGLLGGWTDAEKTQIQNYQNQFAQLNTNNTTMVERRGELYKKAVLAEKTYQHNYVIGIAKIRPLLIDMLISVRSELDVSLDSNWYKEFSTAIDTEISEKFKGIIDRTHQVDGKSD